MIEKASDELYNCRHQKKKGGIFFYTLCIAPRIVLLASGLACTTKSFSTLDGMSISLILIYKCGRVLEGANLHIDRIEFCFWWALKEFCGNIFYSTILLGHSDFYYLIYVDFYVVDPSIPLYVVQPWCHNQSIIYKFTLIMAEIRKPAEYYSFIFSFCSRIFCQVSHDCLTDLHICVDDDLVLILQHGCFQVSV
jgi:hypothetical protein